MIIARILACMKLAEALALRADAAQRAEQLRARVTASARYQEGETPAEDAAALLDRGRRGPRRAGVADPADQPHQRRHP